MSLNRPRSEGHLYYSLYSDLPDFFDSLGFQSFPHFHGQSGGHNLLLNFANGEIDPGSQFDLEHGFVFTSPELEEIVSLVDIVDIAESGVNQERPT